MSPRHPSLVQLSDCKRKSIVSRMQRKSWLPALASHRPVFMKGEEEDRGKQITAEPPHSHHPLTFRVYLHGKTYSVSGNDPHLSTAAQLLFTGHNPLTHDPFLHLSSLISGTCAAYRNNNLNVMAYNTHCSDIYSTKTVLP